MRQTNHNGRVSKKTGSVYNRKHNDREFDLRKATNIDASRTADNITILFDANNNLAIYRHEEERPTIDVHEHQIYEELFSESLSAQHARNEKARHPERNKSIDDLLNNKFTCPEETIFQIGSVEDAQQIDANMLMSIFYDFIDEEIELYGENLHFLDAVLHMDESTPHIHIRKVWTHHGKDGLDISQNKALGEMGFERPNPNQPPSAKNNAKITFSEWEREIRIRACERNGMEIESKPKYPGKRTMDKEEFIAIKLQRKNEELSEELEETEREVRSIRRIIKEKISTFINTLKANIFEHFDGRHQREALDAMWSVPIDQKASEKLKSLGYKDCWPGQAVGLILYDAEKKDIKDALVKAGLDEANSDSCNHLFDVQDKLNRGTGIEKAIEELTEEITQAVQNVRRRHR